MRIVHQTDLFPVVHGLLLELGLDVRVRWQYTGRILHSVHLRWLVRQLCVVMLLVRLFHNVKIDVYDRVEKCLVIADSSRTVGPTILYRKRE